MKKAYELLSVYQLDEKLKNFKVLKDIHPKQGWCKYIRTVLNLPATKLAKFIGITQPSIMKMEENEQNKKITLETLEKLANAMGCDLVYAFVPKKSFDHFIETKQKEAMKKFFNETHHTMMLENQELDQKSLKIQKEIYEKSISSESLKKLWKQL
ncbi:MAG: hypothetical protein CNLJKLNK_01418 [Holosporales bacterium]